MFENVGEKIRNYAKGLFIVQLIIYIIGGIVMLVVSDGEGGLIIGGIALLALGWAIAWLDSVFIYGFGELIVKTSEIARNTKTKLETSTNEDSVEEQQEEVKSPQIETTPLHQWRCDKCGNMISKEPCPICGGSTVVPYWCLKCGHKGPYRGEHCPSCGSSLKVYKTK